jgi:hypothetical protein
LDDRANLGRALSGKTAERRKLKPVVRTTLDKVVLLTGGSCTTSRAAAWAMSRGLSRLVGEGKFERGEQLFGGNIAADVAQRPDVECYRANDRDLQELERRQARLQRDERNIRQERREDRTAPEQMRVIDA